MKQVRRLVPYGVFALLVTANVTVFMQRVTLADWWSLRNYQAPVAIAQLVQDDRFTPEAAKLFYVNHPALEDRDTFNKQCGSEIEKSVVLGCYHGDRQGIHLYDVSDERLHGVEQVTAAHEMLHQAYDRLSPDERSRIAKLLENFAANDLQDQRIKDKIALYKKTEPGALDSEMHSIFGTEIKGLPMELEQYYQRYFIDRNVVITYSDAYENEFTRRKALVAHYDQQLQDLDSKIERNRADLDVRLKALNQKRTDVEKSTAQGNSAEYQANAVAYNRMVGEYNQMVDATRAYIDEYNQIVATRNEIAIEQQQLQSALDSRPPQNIE